MNMTTEQPTQPPLSTHTTINCLICGGSARPQLGRFHGDPAFVCDTNAEHVASSDGAFYLRSQETTRKPHLDYSSYHVRFANGLD